MTPLAPVITSVGLADAMAASNDGLELAITHLAFGDGGQDAGQGYTPNASMTALVRERARVPVAGGERVAPSEIQVEAYLDVGPNFWVREVAFISQTGRPFAIWSHPTIPLGYKLDGVPLVVAYALAVTALPDNLITVLVTGPNVNLSMAEPFIKLATEVVRLQTRETAHENHRLIPTFNAVWQF